MMRIKAIVLAIALVTTSMYVQAAEMPPELYAKYGNQYDYKPNTGEYINKSNPDVIKLYSVGVGYPPQNCLAPAVFAKQAAIIDAYIDMAWWKDVRIDCTRTEMTRKQADFMAKHSKICKCEWDTKGKCTVTIELTIDRKGWDEVKNAGNQR